MTLLKNRVKFCSDICSEKRNHKWGEVTNLLLLSVTESYSLNKTWIQSPNSIILVPKTLSLECNIQRWIILDSYIRSAFSIRNGTAKVKIPYIIVDRQMHTKFTQTSESRMEEMGEHMLSIFRRERSDTQNPGKRFRDRKVYMLYTKDPGHWSVPIWGLCLSTIDHGA